MYRKTENHHQIFLVKSIEIQFYNKAIAYHFGSGQGMYGLLIARLG
jgi:hypothetical protein